MNCLRRALQTNDVSTALNIIAKANSTNAILPVPTQVVSQLLFLGLRDQSVKLQEHRKLHDELRIYTQTHKLQLEEEIATSDLMHMSLDSEASLDGMIRVLDSVQDTRLLRRRTFLPLYDKIGEDGRYWMFDQVQERMKAVGIEITESILFDKMKVCAQYCDKNIRKHEMIKIWQEFREFQMKKKYGNLELDQAAIDTVMNCSRDCGMKTEMVMVNKDTREFQSSIGTQRLEEWQFGPKELDIIEDSMYGIIHDEARSKIKELSERNPGPCIVVDAMNLFHQFKTDHRSFSKAIDHLVELRNERNVVIVMNNKIGREKIFRHQCFRDIVDSGNVDIVGMNECHEDILCIILTIIAQKNSLDSSEKSFLVTRDKFRDHNFLITNGHYFRLWMHLYSAQFNDNFEAPCLIPPSSFALFAQQLQNTPNWVFPTEQKNIWLFVHTE